jgi:hypothetical protein
MMAAVAIVAVLAASWTLYQRREMYRRAAERHRMGSLWPTRDGVHRNESESVEASRRAWNRKLAVKYERAARYPWLPVAPDPPEPE